MNTVKNFVGSVIVHTGMSFESIDKDTTILRLGTNKKTGLPAGIPVSNNFVRLGSTIEDNAAAGNMEFEVGGVGFIIVGPLFMEDGGLSRKLGGQEATGRHYGLVNTIVERLNFEKEEETVKETVVETVEEKPATTLWVDENMNVGLSEKINTGNMRPGEYWVVFGRRNYEGKTKRFSKKFEFGKTTVVENAAAKSGWWWKVVAQFKEEAPAYIGVWTSLKVIALKKNNPAYTHEEACAIVRGEEDNARALAMEAAAVKATKDAADREQAEALRQLKVNTEKKKAGFGKNAPKYAPEVKYVSTTTKKQETPAAPEVVARMTDNTKAIPIDGPVGDEFRRRAAENTRIANALAEGNEAARLAKRFDLKESDDELEKLASMF